MKTYWPTVSLLALVVAACAQAPPTSPTTTTSVAATGDAAQVAGQGPNHSPDAATVQFGQESAGSPFPPGSGHDQSGHGADNLVPRTVVIRTGGTVTFNVPPAVHQVVIYEPGTEPDDIDTTALTSLAAFAGCGAPLPAELVNAPLVIDDATNREAAYPVPCLTPAQVTHRFDAPGRYLVICAFLPHFEAQMYGWVIVRD